MKPASIQTIYFSPTGSSRKIAEATAHGIASQAGAWPTDAAPIVRHDLTHRESVEIHCEENTVAVIAAPVYGGKIAPAARARLDKIAGKQTPAVLIVLYGNRDIGGALPELADLVIARGFIPIAAAAFVGEHSYSTAQRPIAVGRPDARDLAEATAFGAAVRKKLTADRLTPIHAARLKAPATPLFAKLRFLLFVVAYRHRQRKNPHVYLPACDADRCTHCGKCAAICPTEAIMRGHECHTEAARCIRCCACVKGCPVGARTFYTPFAEVLARNFAHHKAPVILL